MGIFVLHHGLLVKIIIDKSGANTAAIRSVNAATCSDIELRQSQQLNNSVKQDHRAIFAANQFFRLIF